MLIDELQTELRKTDRVLWVAWLTLGVSVLTMMGGIDVRKRMHTKVEAAAVTKGIHERFARVDSLVRATARVDTVYVPNR